MHNCLPTCTIWPTGILTPTIYSLTKLNYNLIANILSWIKIKTTCAKEFHECEKTVCHVAVAIWLTHITYHEVTTRSNVCSNALRCPHNLEQESWKKHKEYIINIFIVRYPLRAYHFLRSHD